MHGISGTGFSLLAILALKSLALSTTVHAQDTTPAQPSASPSEDNTYALETIVVTAEKRAQDIQRVPVAVTALTGDVLTSSGVEAAISLPRLTPGLAVNSSAGFSSPYIRGIGTQYASLGLESSVATYYNGVYLSRPLSGLLSFNDVERIEVLRGPQGTLYGRNSAAGAIRVVTRDPVQHFEGNVAMLAGNYDSYGMEGMLNIPVSKDLAVRLAGRFHNRESYLDAAYGGMPKPGDHNESLISGKVLWTPTDRLSVKLALDLEKLHESDQIAFVNLDNSIPEQVGLARGGRGRTGFYTTPANSKFSDQYVNGLPREYIEMYGGELRVDYELDPFTVSLISGYRSSDGFNSGDIDGSDRPYQHNFFAERSELHSQEIQAVSNSTGPFKWIAGAYYVVEDGKGRFDLFGESVNDIFGLPYGTDIGSMDGGAALHMRSRIRAESFAPYLQADYEVAPGLTVTAGARYTQETKRLLSNDATVTGAGPEFSIFSESAIRYKFNKFTPKLTLSYEATDETLIYATYSEGFKSGGVNTPTSAPQAEILPEDLESYEIGLKFSTRTARLSAAAFYYDYTNLQVQVRDPDTGVNVVQNAANAEVYGVEVEGTASIGYQWEVGGGVSYLHARYDSYIGAAFAPASGTAACAAAGGAAVRPIPIGCEGSVSVEADFADMPLTNAPDWSAHIRASYIHDLGAAGELQINSLLSYQDEFYHAVGSLLEPSKTLLSANLTWRSPMDRYTVVLSGDNLTQRKYYSYRTQTAAARYGVVGAPRTYSLKVGYQF